MVYLVFVDRFNQYPQVGIMSSNVTLIARVCGGLPKSVAFPLFWQIFAFRLGYAGQP
jgi:hypothetical protein